MAEVKGARFSTSVLVVDFRIRLIPLDESWGGEGLQG